MPSDPINKCDKFIPSPTLPLGLFAIASGSRASILYPPTLRRTFGNFASISSWLSLANFKRFKIILVATPLLTLGLLFSIFPKLYIEPSNNIASISRTLSRIIPYLIDLPPQLLFPAMPPIVALLEVETSTGNQSPKGFKKRFNSSKTIPGSTIQVIFSLSKSIILFKNLELSITIALLTVCPHCDVPPPLANNGILLSLA